MRKRARARRWKRWSPDHAAQVVRTWRRSGLSAAEFGRREGLDPQRLLRWRQKLAAKPGRMADSRPRLQPVQVVQDAPAASATVGIELPQGICVRVPAGVDEATLRCVLRVLRDAA